MLGWLCEQTWYEKIDLLNKGHHRIYGVRCEMAASQHCLSSGAVEEDLSDYQLPGCQI